MFDEDEGSDEDELAKDYYIENFGDVKGIDPYYVGLKEVKDLQERREYYGDLVMKLLSDLFLNSKDIREQLENDEAETDPAMKLDYLPPKSTRKGDPPTLQLSKKLAGNDKKAKFFVEEALTNFIYQCTKEILYREDLLTELGDVSGAVMDSDDLLGDV